MNKEKFVLSILWIVVGVMLIFLLFYVYNLFITF